MYTDIVQCRRLKHRGVACFIPTVFCSLIYRSVNEQERKIKRIIFISHWLTRNRKHFLYDALTSFCSSFIGKFKYTPLQKFGIFCLKKHVFNKNLWKITSLATSLLCLWNTMSVFRMVSFSCNHCSQMNCHWWKLYLPLTRKATNLLLLCTKLFKCWCLQPQYLFPIGSSNVGMLLSKL